MEKLELIELAAHRKDIVADVRGLLDKYRAIFEWDVPDVDEKLVEKLIIAEMRTALADIETELHG